MQKSRAGFSDFVPDCMIIHLFLVGWVMYFFVRFLCRFYLTNTIDKVIKAYRRLFLKLFIDSAEYLAYSVPFNSHELSYAFLGAVHSEPGYSVLK